MDMMLEAKGFVLAQKHFDFETWHQLGKIPFDPNILIL
jgi:hypothetical protein